MSYFSFSVLVNTNFFVSDIIIIYYSSARDTKLAIHARKCMPWGLRV